MDAGSNRKIRDDLIKPRLLSRRRQRTLRAPRNASGRSDGARMVAVRLREAPRTNATPATMTLITPKGLRVEGLAVEQAVAILRALG